MFLGIQSYTLQAGKNVDEALNNLKEAIELYLDDEDA
jgi:predicted RNase H-like HicB family nuclease